jgi:DNA invertase Pin-like site-specific DNA recombinase
MNNNKNKNKNKNKKCCIYARCSSPRQEDFLLHTQLQIDDCKKMAKHRKLEVKDIFMDNKHAVKPNSRPNFEIMLKRIKSGEFDFVICDTLDRLFCNDSDSIKLCRLFRQGSLRPIITTEGEFSPSCDTFPLCPSKKSAKCNIE